MCTTLRAFGAQNRRDARDFVLAAARAAAARDMKQQADRRIIAGAAERTQPPSAAGTSPMSPSAPAVAEAFLS